MQRNMSRMNKMAIGSRFGISMMLGAGVFLSMVPAGALAGGGESIGVREESPKKVNKGKASPAKVVRKQSTNQSAKRSVKQSIKPMRKQAKPTGKQAKRVTKRTAQRATQQVTKRSTKRVTKRANIAQGKPVKLVKRAAPRPAPAQQTQRTSRPVAMASGPTSGHGGGHSAGGHSSGRSSGRSAGHSSGRSSSHATRSSSGRRSGPSTKPSTKPSSRPSSGPSHQPKHQPSTRTSTKPRTKPSTKPSTKQSTKPSTKPGNGPSTRPGTRPSRPSTGPGTRPSTRPSTGPNTRPGTRINPGSTPSTGPTTRPTRSPGVTTLPGGGSGGVVNQGTRRQAASGLTGRPVVRSNDTPRGFDIEKARNAFISRTKPKGDAGVKGRNTDGGKSGVGGIDAADDGSGGGSDDSAHTDGDGHGDHDGDGDESHDDDHDPDHDGDDDDGDYDHDGGHLGNHHYYNQHYPYYTHYSSPYGWWYLYGDFDGDGYTDYVVTNGSHSVYWYGWSGYYWGASPWYGFYGSGYSWWNNSVPGHYRGPIYGTNNGLTNDPAYSTTPVDADSLPEAMPLSALEVARLEMSVGDPEIAVDAYRAHLSEYPNDWIAVRELGIAKIRVGNRGDGVALVNYAYAMEPELAKSVVPTSIFADSERALRDAVVSVVGWGNRNPSPSAWLSVAVLMQAEGRNGPALKMVDRAAGYGLDPMVVTEMRAALVRR